MALNLLNNTPKHLNTLGFKDIDMPQITGDFGLFNKEIELIAQKKKSQGT